MLTWVRTTPSPMRVTCIILIIAAIVIAVMIALVTLYSSDRGTQNEPITIGILHSLTGAMAISERSVVDGPLLAVDEINDGGGVIGRQISPVIVDGRPDWLTFQLKSSVPNVM